MKKVLAKILCLSMIALSLTSCGGKKNRNKASATAELKRRRGGSDCKARCLHRSVAGNHGSAA